MDNTPDMTDPGLSNFLANYSQEICDLVMQTRSVILSAFPQALEMVDPPSGIIAYGYSPKYAHLVCAIAPFKSYINLMFSRGVDLPDPAGMLAGTGKRARHVRIESRIDIQRPEFRDLILAAINLT